MTTLLKIIFWASCFLVLYPYFIYPAVLWAASLVRGKGVRKAEGEPDKRATVMISAYNEEETIEDKILNTLELDYPRELLEVFVVSDGSTDGTDEIARRFADRGVVLKRYEGRIGKTGCLNRAVPEASGEIILFTDANSRLDGSALKKMVSLFSDDEIGFVTGGTRYVSEDDGTESVGFYARLEALTKKLESRTGSCVGADGAIFAVRKDLYMPLRETDINDLVIPFKVVIQGGRGVYSQDVFCTEKTAGSARGEFNRQVRITTRTIRAVMSHAALLNPMSFGEFSLKLISHKLLRLLVPPFMLLAALSNLLLVASGYVYTLALIAQVLFYGLAWMKHSGRGPGGLPGILSMPYTFTTVNIAVFKGWVNFLKGETFVTWQPAR